MVKISSTVNGRGFMYKTYMMIFIMMLGIGSLGAEESFSEEVVCLPEEPVTCVGAYDDEVDGDDLDGENLDLGVDFGLADDDDDDMAVSP
jgi:hypothetical protein